MTLWERFVERFVPELADQPSRLDALDGVGHAPHGAHAPGQASAPEVTNSSKGSQTPSMPNHP
jgi:hypothetical protein